MTHTPTKNSETLKAWMLSGFTPCDPDDQGATFIVDGQWYAPMWGCDTLQVILETGDVPDTRAPVDLDSPSTEITGTYPERGEGEETGRNAATNEKYSVYIGQHETGIDWGKEWSKIRLQYPRRAWSTLIDDTNGPLLMEYAAQIALSRQSAAGGDWEKELSDLVDQASGMESVTGAASWVVSQAKQILRRALRATRTPEVDWDAVDMILMEAEDIAKGDVGDLITRARGLIHSTPPPRPTATGGITVKDVDDAILRVMSDNKVDDPNDPLAVTLAEFRHALIERAEPATGGITVEDVERIAKKIGSFSHWKHEWIVDLINSALIERAGEEGE